jgi:hypothetical protein
MTSYRKFNLLKPNEKKSGGKVKLWEKGQVKMMALIRQQEKNTLTSRRILNPGEKKFEGNVKL